MTLPEVLLWTALRKRQVAGWRFRRQHPIGPYVLDFYCEELKIALEVDGEAHGLGDHPRRDAVRDRWLYAQGVTTIRLSARDVLRSPDDALTAVEIEVADILRLRRLRAEVSDAALNAL